MYPNRQLHALVTLKQYDGLAPCDQGYTWYLQAELQDSPLKGQTNPYVAGSLNYVAWNRGVAQAQSEASDNED